MNEDEQLIFDRLTFPKNQEDVNNLFGIFKNFLFKATQNHGAREYDYSIRRDMVLILQMIFTKVATLEKTIETIEYVSEDGVPLHKVIDQTLVTTAVRGLYESIGMFNTVFVNPQSKDERGVLHVLWVIAGLKFRQRFAVFNKTPESEAKTKSENDIIIKYISDIRDTELYKSLSLIDQQKIETVIKKNSYSVFFTDGKVKVLNGFQELVNNAGISKYPMGLFYTHLSLHAHPSYIGVKAFGNMFEAKNPDFFKLSLFTLDVAFKLVSVFIADYIKVNPEVKSTFDALDEVSKNVIQYNNIFLRSEKYEII
ncbi:hypothetical protein [Pedobacter sp. L105]|uniref:hypothetical protein n=1 Tax=Pedobacter sp. L105 TaxID=1641871 RepID=UPI00131B359B|nr:hypothetical protein [Pedobacter sp. L105]